MGWQREYRKDKDRRESDEPEVDETEEPWRPSPGKSARAQAAAGSRPRRVETPIPGRVTLTSGLSHAARPAAPAAPVFRHAVDVAKPAADAPERVQAARQAAGRPLPEALARQLERALGPAVADIRVHDDSKAAAAARALRAEAYTVGRDIFFAGGAYDPSSARGQRLIAHEAAHAASQPTFVALGDDLAISQPGDAHEREADSFADAFATRAEATEKTVLEARGSSDPARRADRTPKDAESKKADADAARTRTGRGEARTADPARVPELPAPRATAPVGLYRQVALSTDDDSEANDADRNRRNKGAGGAGERKDDEADELQVPTGGNATAGDPAGRQVERPGTGGGVHGELGARLNAGGEVRSADRPLARDKQSSKPKEERPPAIGPREEPGETEADDGAPEAGQAAPPPKKGRASSARGGEIVFAPTDLGKLLPPIAPEETVDDRHASERAALERHEAARAHATATLTSFVSNGKQQVGAIQGLAPGLDQQLHAGESRAIAAVDAAAASQARAVRAHVAQSIAQVDAAAAAARARIEADHKATVTAIEDSTRAARDRVDASHRTSLEATQRQEQEQLQVVARLYEAAAGKFRTAGSSAGNLAVSNAEGFASGYLSHMIHRDDSFLKGPLTDNRCKARADAARGVGAKYKEELGKEAENQIGEMNKRRPTDEESVRAVAAEARKNLDTVHKKSLEGLDEAKTQSLEGARTTREQMLAQVDSTRSGSVSGLNRHGQSQASGIQRQGAQLKQTIRQQRQARSAQLHAGLDEATVGLRQGIDGMIDGMRGAEVPEPEALNQAIATAEEKLAEQMAKLRQGMTQGAAQGAQGLVQVGTQGAQSLQQAGSAAINAASQMVAGARDSFSSIAQGARQSLQQLSAGHKRMVDEGAKATDEGMKGVVTGLRDSYGKLSKNLEDGADKNAKAIGDAFRNAVTGGGEKDMPAVIRQQADEAASKVQPRWKSVLKWIIIIAIIIVVAVVLGPMVIGAVAGAATALGASAAAASVIGTIVGGALVGAASSALTTVVDNAFSGRNLMEGVLKAAAWGAAGGAIGGAFGVGKLGTMIQGLSKGRQFAVQLAIDASVDTGMTALQGDLSWEGFAQGLAMSVLTNGMTHLPKVGPRIEGIQTRSGAMGNDFGTRVGERIRPPSTDGGGTGGGGGVDVSPPTPNAPAPTNAPTARTDAGGAPRAPDAAPGGQGPRTEGAPRTDGGAPDTTGPRTETRGPDAPAPDRTGGPTEQPGRTRQPGSDEGGTGGTRDGDARARDGEPGQGGTTRDGDTGGATARDGDTGGATTRDGDTGGATTRDGDGATTRDGDGASTRDDGARDGATARDGQAPDGKPRDGQGPDGKPRDGEGGDTRARDGQAPDGKPRDGKPGESKPRGEGDARTRDGDGRTRDGDGRTRDGDGTTRDGDEQADRTQDGAEGDRTGVDVAPTVDPSRPVGPGGYRSDAISLTGKGDKLGEAVRWIKPEPGKIDVIVHGSSDSFYILKDGAYVAVDHRTLARYIKKQGGAGQDIRLISCGSGESPTSIAQNLANKLGARVTAPSDTVWIHPDGRMTVGKNPDHSTGGWNEFQPGTRPDAGTTTRPAEGGTRPDVDTGTRPDVEAGPGTRPDVEEPGGARPRTDEEAPVAAEGPRRSPSDDEGMLGVLNGGSRDEIKLATGFDDAQIDLIVARRPIGKLLDLQSIDGITPRQAGDLQAREKRAQIELDESPAVAALRDQFAQRFDALRADPANAHKSDYDLMKEVVRGDPATFCLKGECVPLDVLQAQGAFSKVIGMESVFNYHLTPDARTRLKNDYGIETAADFAAAVARDPSIFEGSMLDTGSMVSGQNNVAWWAPRGDATAGSAAELVTQLALDPSYYQGGLIRVTMSPEAAAGFQFRKPTPFDGMMFGEWVANRDGGPLGVTGGGTPEAVAPGLPLGQASDVEIFAGSAPPTPRVSGGSGDGGPAPMTSSGDSSPPTGTSSSGAVSAGPPPPTGPVSAGPPVPAGDRTPTTRTGDADTGPVAAGVEPGTGSTGNRGDGTTPTSEPTPETGAPRPLEPAEAVRLRELQTSEPRSQSDIEEMFALRERSGEPIEGITPPELWERWQAYSRDAAQGLNDNWSWQRWARQCETNWNNPSRGLGRERELAGAVGGSSRVVQVGGRNRQVDALVPARPGRRPIAIQLRTGPDSLGTRPPAGRPDRLSTVEQLDLDAALTQEMRVIAVYEGGASGPLIRATRARGIEVVIVGEREHLRALLMRGPEGMSRADADALLDGLTIVPPGGDVLQTVVTLVGGG